MLNRDREVAPMWTDVGPVVNGLEGTVNLPIRICKASSPPR